MADCTKSAEEKNIWQYGCDYYFWCLNFFPHYWSNESAYKCLYIWSNDWMQLLYLGTKKEIKSIKQIFMSFFF